MENIAKDRKVIPEPIDDRKFQEWKESGKSGILLPNVGTKDKPKEEMELENQKKIILWEVNSFQAIEIKP